MATQLNVVDLHEKIIHWRNQSRANRFDPQTCACHVDAYQSVLVSHGLPMLPTYATVPDEPAVENEPIVTKEQLATIKPCYNCENTKVSFCAVSIRPYCGECHTWGNLNMAGNTQDAIDVWNSIYEVAHAAS